MVNSSMPLLQGEASCIALELLQKKTSIVYVVPVINISIETSLKILNGKYLPGDNCELSERCKMLYVCGMQVHEVAAPQCQVHSVNRHQSQGGRTRQTLANVLQRTSAFLCHTFILGAIKKHKSIVNTQFIQCIIYTYKKQFNISIMTGL